MANAAGHLLGQHIGNTLEAAIKPYLQDLANKHKLYLDTHGARPGVREGRKLSWTDQLGNSHDLDFVLERGGTPTKGGQPAAFIEAAWRRYTKHSKAKAQEVQGAVLPVLEKWSNVHPAAAAIIAGEWTNPALRQLESSGFTILHLDFPKTVASFKKFGINIEGNGEATDDDFWSAQTAVFENLGSRRKQDLAKTLREDHSNDFARFTKKLELRIIRKISHVIVTPLHGQSESLSSVEDAIERINNYSQGDALVPFVRFEIRITYTNGDKIDASVSDAIGAKSFLENFL